LKTQLCKVNWIPTNTFHKLDVDLTSRLC